MSFSILAVHRRRHRRHDLAVAARAPGGLLTEAEPRWSEYRLHPVAAVSVSAVTDSGTERVMSWRAHRWRASPTRGNLRASKYDKGSSWPAGAVGSPWQSPRRISKARQLPEARQDPGRQIRYPGCARRREPPGRPQGRTGSGSATRPRAGERPPRSSWTCSCLGGRQPGRCGPGHRPPLRRLPAEELPAAR